MDFQPDPSSLYSVLGDEMSHMTFIQTFLMIAQVATETHQTSHPIVGKIVDTCNLHSPTQYLDANTVPPGQYDPLCGLWYYAERYLTKRWVQGILAILTFLIPFIPTYVYFVV